VLDFEVYVDQINNQNTVSTVFSKFTDAMSRLGFDVVSFQTITGFGDCRTSLMSGNGSYTRDVYVDTEHSLFKQALTQKGPFFETGTELCIPLRGVGGSFALIRAFYTRPAGNNRSKTLSFVNAISSIFYTRICSLCFEHKETMLLTKKERDILKMVAEGKTKATIAESLGVTTHAVDFHFRNILKKHGTNRIVVAVAESIRSGAI